MGLQALRDLRTSLYTARSTVTVMYEKRTHILGTIILLPLTGNRAQATILTRIPFYYLTVTAAALEIKRSLTSEQSVCVFSTFVLLHQESYRDSPRSGEIPIRAIWRSPPPSSFFPLFLNYTTHPLPMQSPPRLCPCHQPTVDCAKEEHRLNPERHPRRHFLEACNNSKIIISLP